MKLFSTVVAFVPFCLGFVSGFLARAFWGGAVVGWYIVVQTEAQAVVDEVEIRRNKKIVEGLRQGESVL